MKNAVILWLLLFKIMPLAAFPENVRQGYASCQTCHVSPTGGGVLTEYGRRTSEEFLSTWQYKNEADFLYGIGPRIPESWQLGGDIRSVALQKDNRATLTKAYIPMQADLEAAFNISEFWTVAVSAGAYDQSFDTRRHYILYKPSEYVHGRVGRFMRAYGLLSADHSLLSRKLLGFDQGQETNNLELGVTTENTEFVLNLTKNKDIADINGKEDGVAGRAVMFLGKRAYAGISYLHAQGAVWNRDAFGPFFVWGFSQSIYVEGEYDYLTKKAADAGDLSTPDHKSMISFTRIAWETIQGLHLFASAESVDAVGDIRYEARQRVWGPGLQWFPRPHLEFMAKLEQRLNETYSPDFGSQYLIMSHVYF